MAQLISNELPVVLNRRERETLTQTFIPTSYLHVGMYLESLLNADVICKILKDTPWYLDTSSMI